MKETDLFQDVQCALDKLNDKFPRPNLMLEMTDVYDLEKDWNESYPGVGLPGVYFFADENRKTQYIGKSSSELGKRLGDYWKDGNGKAVPKNDKSKGVRYIATITVSEDRAFEASSIEEWLIREIKPKPPGNKLGT